MRKNQLALQSAARYIETLASSQRVVVWGVGRIFDSLVRYGRLDVTLLTGIVDKYLAAFTKRVHSCPLLDPEDLLALAPDIVVIASRAYFTEIQQELVTMVPDCVIVGLQDSLFAGAKPESCIYSVYISHPCNILEPHQFLQNFGNRRSKK